MFRLWMTNFDYYCQDEYSSLDEAIAAAKRKSFQIAIHCGKNVLASICPINGVRHYNGR